MRFKKPFGDNRKPALMINSSQKILKNAAFFDVDGTLTSQHAWQGIMNYFKEKNLRRWTHRAYMGFHMPLYFLRRMGLISESRFRAPWAANLAWFLRGYTEEQGSKIWDWTVTEFLNTSWREDTRTIFNNHLYRGDIVVLVSSGPLPFIQRIGQELKTEHAVGTKLDFKNGTYTGRSLPPVCIDKYKATLTKEYLQSNGINIDFETSYSYADSIADLQLLEMVGNPVAVHPDDALREEAHKRGWSIIPE